MTTDTRTTHTPGPWEVYDGHDGHFATAHESYIQQGGERTGLARWTIARMLDNGSDNSADARLIAAAPELLAALDTLAFAIRDAVEHGPEQIRNGWTSRKVSDAEALIAKARGDA